MTKVLELTFLLSNEKSYTITIANPKPNSSDAEIDAAMTAIVASNYFDSKGHTIVGKKQARYVERTVTNVALA
ncbi:MAG: DUF2922 domain-containing protein [Lysinibacillus sp.]